MSTEVWPPASAEVIAQEHAASLARELEWLLESLQSTLKSLKAGLEECAALLAPSEPGNTLVLSSHRSESVKGIITRIGTRIPKGNIQVRLATLPPPRSLTSAAGSGSTTPANYYPLKVSEKPQATTLVLEQLVQVRTLVNACLDVIDVGAWTGDAKDARFIAGQLRLLEENMRDAKAALKGGGVGREGMSPWWEDDPADDVYDPPLPKNVSCHVCIADAAIVLVLRTLAPAARQTPSSEPGIMSRFGFGDRLAVALGAVKLPTHDEMDKTFTYRDQEVVVKEKVRVETQDPSLMAALAKLGSLERVVKMSRQSLSIVMGTYQNEED